MMNYNILSKSSQLIRQMLSTARILQGMPSIHGSFFLSLMLHLLKKTVREAFHVQKDAFTDCQSFIVMLVMFVCQRGLPVMLSQLLFQIIGPSSQKNAVRSAHS